MQYIAAKKPLKVKADDVKVDVPVEYKQYDDFAEFITDAGGEESGLKVLNRWMRHFSLSDGRNTGNSRKKNEGEQPSEFVERVINEVQSAVKNHKPSVGRGMSQKAQAEGFVAITGALAELKAKYTDQGLPVPPEELEKLMQAQIAASL